MTPRPLLPLHAVLHLDMALGDIAGDFDIHFEVQSPDLTDTENYIFEIAEIDRPPQPITRLRPSYPSKARVRRIEGTVSECV